MRKIILILLFFNLPIFCMEKNPNIAGFVEILEEVIASRGSNLVYSMVVLEYCDLYVNPKKTIKNPTAKEYLDNLSLLEGDQISAEARNTKIKPGEWEAWKIDIRWSDLLEKDIKKKQTK